MHLLVILTVITAAYIIRNSSLLLAGTWSDRWHQALFVLIFPALLLLTTAIAILWMGCHGAMLGLAAGSLGCIVSASLMLFALWCLIKLAYQGNRSLKQLNTYKQEVIAGKTARIIEQDFLYSAQIGFWNSELVVSRGLLATLDEEHLAAVLAHEQAHQYYRDTFWFFWLGWLRSFTIWLPNTEALWQELLLLRELRADRQAAQKVDYLLLAESLLTVVKTPLETASLLCANFGDSIFANRLNERINFLLAQPEPISRVQINHWQNWGWVCWLFLPLMTIPLHY
ncbi:M56 family metallopeptidase [Pleurocapsa sp. PCC 7319]|uniref:M56 family metallopeptidase n=1 Tax=Pleurocapsa sp. PCC 7319 TaxID=118161 RepID=UPI00034CA60C|nr:M56 family metallopeptidase [Pleurocapsa sp. PCC 7319]